MISKHLFLLPSPSCDDEDSIKKLNISKIFAVKSPEYKVWLEDQINNGLDPSDFHSFENLETISNVGDEIKSPDLEWIHEQVLKGENVGIMCANGFQRAIPVLCKYTKEHLDMPIYETILKIKDAYPYAITNPKIYSEFIETLNFI